MKIACHPERRRQRRTPDSGDPSLPSGWLRRFSCDRGEPGHCHCCCRVNCCRVNCCRCCFRCCHCCCSCRCCRCCCCRGFLHRCAREEEHCGDRSTVRARCAEDCPRCCRDRRRSARRRCDR